MYFNLKGSMEEYSQRGLFFKRPLLEGFRGVFTAFVGDVLEVFFFKKGQPFCFVGVCLAIYSKHFSLPETALVLRNFIAGVGVECIFSYFYNRVYFLRIHTHKKLELGRRHSKFFFLRLQTTL